MDAFERAALDGQIARLGRTGADDGRVELGTQLFRRVVLPDLGVAEKGHALVFEQLDAAEDDLVLIELHVRDAIHEQSARTIGTFKNRDGVAGFVELRGGAQASGAGADDGDLFVGANFRRLRRDPALVPAFIDDRNLDVLDRDRRRVDAEHARALARRGTDAARELGEVVRLMQPLQRFLPQAAIDEVIPFRDEVVDRAAAGHAADQRAGVAKRDAAIHAARALRAEFVLRQVEMKLLPVAGAFQRRAVSGDFAEIFDEAGWFSHGCVFEKLLTELFPVVLVDADLT